MGPISLPARVWPGSFGFFVWHDVQEGVSGLPVAGSEKNSDLPRSPEKPEKDGSAALASVAYFSRMAVCAGPASATASGADPNRERTTITVFFMVVLPLEWR